MIYLRNATESKTLFIQENVKYYRGKIIGNPGVLTRQTKWSTVSRERSGRVSTVKMVPSI